MFSLPFCFTVCWWFILSKAVLCWCILLSEDSFGMIRVTWHLPLFCFSFFFLFYTQNVILISTFVCYIWYGCVIWNEHFLHDVAIIHYNTNGAEQAQVLHEINPFWMRLASNWWKPIGCYSVQLCWDSCMKKCLRWSLCMKKIWTAAIRITRSWYSIPIFFSQIGN